MEFLSSYLLSSGRVSPHSVSLSLLTYFMTSFTPWAFHRCGLCALPALWWAGLYTSLPFLTEWISFHVEFSWEKPLLHGNVGFDTLCVCVCVCVYATIQLQSARTSPLIISHPKHEGYKHSQIVKLHRHVKKSWMHILLGLQESLVTI